MTQPKAKCSQCTRRVDIGSFTGTYALHNNKSGEICSGSSTQIPKELLPLANLRNPKKSVTKKKKFQKETSGSLFAQFEINQQATIKRSLTEERAVKDAQRSEVGSRNSVRSIGGGLPTLGKNS